MPRVLAALDGAAYLIAAKLDRFARSMIEFATLTELCRESGTTLVTADGMISATTSGSLTKLMALLTEWERDTIAARILASKETLRRTVAGTAEPRPTATGSSSATAGHTQRANWTGPARAWSAPTSGRKKGGADTGPSPVDRRETGSKHHLIRDGRGTPLKVITTAANVNDIIQTLALVDGIPPITDRRGHLRRRPVALLGDKGYDSRTNHRELRRRGILPVISRRGEANIHRLGKLQYLVEQTFAPLHQFKRLTIRWERRTELHDAFTTLACSLICWRRLKRAQP